MKNRAAWRKGAPSIDGCFVPLILLAVGENYLLSSKGETYVLAHGKGGAVAQ